MELELDLRDESSRFTFCSSTKGFGDY